MSNLEGPITGLFAKFLNASQKESIVEDLLSQLSPHSGDQQVIETLCDLLKTEEFSNYKTQAFPKIKDYCFSILANISAVEGADVDLIRLESLRILCGLFVELQECLIEYITQEIGVYLATSGVFVEEITNQEQYKTIIANTPLTGKKIPNRQEIIVDLSFLEKLLAGEQQSSLNIPAKLNVILCYYLQLNDEEISGLASKVFRWTMPLVVSLKEFDPLIWKTILYLTSSSFADKYHHKNGYVLWIRYLSAAIDNHTLKSSTAFQELVKLERYWKILQKMLISPLHEHRKYALTIVQFSVQCIDGCIDNRIMKWSAAENDTYIKEWKRYCVLYEIAGIDTSLHQLEAGSKDIALLLDPVKSKIHSSWGLCLISTAMQAAMDSVRRYALEFVLAIKRENLVMFDETSEFFLKDIFLKYAMQGSLFATQRDSSSISCPYGERFSSFVENILIQLSRAKKLDSLSFITTLILQKLYDDREGFDYSRIYLVIALYKGLRSGANLLSGGHLRLLEKLYQSSNETVMMEKFSQKLSLRLLLKIDTKSVSLQQLVTAIGKFVKSNNGKHNLLNLGYSMLDDELEFLLDFISTSYPEGGLLTLLTSNNVNGFSSIEEIVVILYLIIADKQDDTNRELYQTLTTTILEHNIFPVVLTELTFSKLSKLGLLFPYLQKYYLKLVEELSNNLIKHKGIWSKAYTIVTEQSLFDEDDENLWTDNVNLKKLWISIGVEYQSADPEVVELASDKLRFFSQCYARMKYLVEEDDENNSQVWGLKSINELTKMNSYFFKRLSSGQYDYKLRDTSISLLFDILKDFLSVQLITPELKSQVFQVVELNSSTVDWKSESSMVDLMKTIFIGNEAEMQEPLTDGEVEKIIDTTQQIWSSLHQKTLKLSQQGLHLAIIDLVLSPQVLSRCGSCQIVSEKVTNLTSEIIEQSFGRRSFLPRIARKIAEYQRFNPSEFANNVFLGPLLIAIFSFIRVNANGFRIVPVAAKLYDTIVNYGSGNIYKTIYGPSEASARAQIITIIASLPNNSSIGKSMLDYIVDDSARELHLFEAVKRIDGGEIWKRIQLYSILLVLSSSLDRQYFVPMVETYYEPALAKDASPLVRVYIEWTIARTYLGDVRLMDKLMGILKSPGAMHPSLVMSYERIMFLICQQLTGEIKSQYFKQFLRVLSGLCCSDKTSVRHFSGSLVCSVQKEVDTYGATALGLTEGEIDTITRFYDQVTQNGKVLEYRNGDALVWNASGDFTLVGVCGGVLLKVSDSFEIDAIPESEFRNNVLTTNGPNIPIGEDCKDLWLSTVKTGSGKKSSQFVGGNLSGGGSAKNVTEFDKIALQKKSGAWRTVMDLDDSGKDHNDGTHIQRSDLIVMGSLVNKPPNLGGICRLCDVLGAGLLTIGDNNYKKHAQFKSVAVTADLWLPMEEVKPDDIINFMRKQKANGYTLIGLEQTDKSVQLDHDLKFPQKSLIVLGKEKEGIPGEILAELDFCVEIKQVGVVRSMNIQTATALIVHAYSLQYC
ncbi:tRNA (guanosine(18)-2'-O)-methyltransferase [Saccharomycopsis crataegensis]|uniref:tRNA (Guanosine(18)-2'-O)-methyltransferase n=1 Tax=Saccharomycopsis crataegensis TaxID=43959 RepID=A0AAV5QJC6_9ASCO|nr:tRNA (guanosine(18)-2'-O)-methyltransferase [Saccharomycopsis crataegensis]